MYISIYIFYHGNLYYITILKSTDNILYVVVHNFQSVHCKKRLDKEAYQFKNAGANKFNDFLGVWIGCFVAFISV